VKLANGSSVGRQESGEPFSPEGMHVKDTLEVREIKERDPKLSNNGSEKERTWKPGKEVKIDFFQFGQSQNLSPTVCGNLPQKYVGQWDVGQNKMVWHSLQEGEEVQFEKDPATNTYFPRVGKGTSFSYGQQGSSHPHKGLSGKKVRQQVKKTPLKSSAVSKPYSKRSRPSANLNKSQENQSGLAGKRKLIDEEEEDKEDNAKKGKKSGGDDQRVQVEAGSQPRRLP
jgi:hypothetical protein